MKYINDLKTKYGIWLLLAVAAAVFKVVLFYNLMGVTVNMWIICCITLVIVGLMFDIFSMKWIPFLIYLLISCLMFADVAYSSFFNRYISVAMLGAVDLLTGVTESIKEIVKPKFFLMFIDLIFILAALIRGRRYDRKTALAEDDGEEYEEEDGGYVTFVVKKNDGNNGSSDEGDTNDKPEGIMPVIENGIASFNDQPEGDDGSPSVEDGFFSSFEGLSAAEEIDYDDSDDAEDTNDKGAGGTSDNDAPSHPVRKKKKKKKSKKKPLKIAAKAIELGLVVCMVGGICVNATGSMTLMSIGNREIFSYSTKDILKNVCGIDLNIEPQKSENALYTGTYENQIDGPLFGAAKGRNLIIIQMESFQNFVIGKRYNGKEITPNINKLVSDESTIYFDNYYQQVSAGNTSDAEYATNNGLYGSQISYTYKNYTENAYRGLPVQLKEKYGYTTAVFHAYEADYWNRKNMYPAEGFDNYYCKDDFTTDQTKFIGMGLNDVDWYKESIQYMKKLKQPFYSFLITLSNHHPYYLPAEDTEITLKKQDKDTIFGHYLQSVNYTDYAISQCINELKKAGLYDNSIICIYGDHHGLTVEDDENIETVSRFLGKEYSYETMMNVPLLIHIPGKKVNQTVSVIGGQTDFLPTISYLMGFESLDTLYIGQNLFTAKKGFVAEYYYMNKGSFFDDNKVFVMSGDGVFYNSRAYDRNTGESIPVEECMDGYLKSLSYVNSCEYYLRTNSIQKMFEDGFNEETLLGDSPTIKQPTIIGVAGSPDEDLVGTNTLEALNASYDAGYRYISIDVSWTDDGRAVLLSDWDDLENVFEEPPAQKTYSAFMTGKTKNGLTVMDFAMVSNWLGSHKDAYVAVNVDENMGVLLQAIDTYYSDVRTRVIPVFTKIRDYNRGDMLGYGNLIYKITEDSPYSKTVIRDFIESEDIWAVAIPASEEEEYEDSLEDIGFAYKYYVNNGEKTADIFEEGFDGFFTENMVTENEKNNAQIAEAKAKAKAVASASSSGNVSAG